MKRYLLLFVFFPVFSMSMAQESTDELTNLLSNSEKGKMRKAEYNLDQGKSMLLQYNKGEVGSTVMEGVGYEILFKNMQVNNKTGRLLLESKDYFWEGYLSEIDIFKKYIDYFLESTTSQLTPSVLLWNDSIEYLIAEAKQQRDKSDKVASLKSVGKLIHSSNLDLTKALFFSKKAVKEIVKEIGTSEDLASEAENMESEETIASALKDSGTSGKEPVERVKITEKKEIVKTKEEPKEEVVNPPVVAVKETEESEAESVVNPVIKSTEKEVPEKNVLLVFRNEEEKYEDPGLPYEKGVFFTVQFLATRKSVTDEGVATVYKGSLPVVLNWGDGWYRYSFGKFETLSEAKKELKDSKLIGFIVAYKDGKKIPFKEAFKYLTR